MNQGASSSPQQSEVVPLNLSVPREERPEEAHELRREAVAQIRVAIDVLNARLLALIAVLGAVAIWAWAVVNPAPWTFATGWGYSLGVIVPIVWLYSKRG